MTVSKSLRVNAQISIPRSEIRFTFVRSSGPGGQNVNKVASKAVLRWLPRESGAISSEVRDRVLIRAGRLMNDRGELVLTSQRFRDQGKNVDDCLEKMRLLIAEAAAVPKKRKRTRVPKSTREARLKQKRVTGEKKRLRRSGPADD
jgi:ribosome-associated protein